jgi:ankyrin repeat protein
MKLGVVLLACVLVCVSSGVFASDAGVPAAGAGSGAGASGRYVEVVDEEGLSKLNPVLMRKLAGERVGVECKTLLHYAAFWGEVDAIRALVYWGADINARDRDGDTPLHEAVRCAKKQVITMLLLLGADVAIKNRWDQTPRECNGEEGRRLFDEAHAAYQYILESVGRFENLFGEEMRKRASDKLLHAAKNYRGFSGIQLALVAGADVVVANGDGDTALHLAVHLVAYHSYSMEEDVLPSGLSLHRSTANYRIKTLPPSIKILEFLIRHGAPLDVVNNAGKTAEQVARENGFIEAADFLAREMEKVREGESHSDKRVKTAEK